MAWCFFSTGCFKPHLWAVRVDGAGDVTATHTAWKTTRQVPIMSSPVLLGERALLDFRRRHGELRRRPDWGSLLAGAHERTHLASPLLAEGRVYFFGKDGKTTVVKAGQPFGKLAEN